MQDAEDTPLRGLVAHSAVRREEREGEVLIHQLSVAKAE